jgi:hypothetical protein
VTTQINSAIASDVRSIGLCRTLARQKSLLFLDHHNLFIRSIGSGYSMLMSWLDIDHRLAYLELNAGMAKVWRGGS